MSNFETDSATDELGRETGPSEESPPEGQGELMAEAEEEALDFLEGLLDAMELEGKVELKASPDGLDAFISGEDSGILIGRRGQTLEAIQDLLRTAVQRHVQGHVRVRLDIESYRERRKEAVAAIARDAAESVLERGGEVELDAMSAWERKVVHETIAPLEGVVSFSEGEEPQRRVILKGSSPEDAE